MLSWLQRNPDSITPFSDIPNNNKIYSETQITEQEIESSTNISCFSAARNRALLFFGENSIMRGAVYRENSVQNNIYASLLSIKGENEMTNQHQFNELEDAFMTGVTGVRV